VTLIPGKQPAPYVPVLDRVNYHTNTPLLLSPKGVLHLQPLSAAVGVFDVAQHVAHCGRVRSVEMVFIAGMGA
jgi:hypothetical protein